MRSVKESGKINYSEIPSRDLEATKRFFGDAFGRLPISLQRSKCL